MRLPDDFRPTGLLRLAAVLSGACALAACGGDARPAAGLAAASVNGPQADYPVVIGPSYTAAGRTFVPDDVLNYDEVGYLAADRGGGTGVSGSHHTLPLPSYVEVTSLATGRTILVRLERRGPMDGTDLIALSAGALTQLDAAPGTPVRVRRVNPPEDQRALLRAGQPAPLRLETPMSLVEVLKRKLPEQEPVTVARTMPAQSAATASAARSEAQAAPRAAASAPALPPLDQRETAIAAPAASTRFQEAFETPARPRAEAPAGRFVVQAGAYSTSARAERVAETLGGKVSRAGNLFRVRTGPFASRGEAEASLAKVRAAGYRDARIQTSG